MGQSIQVNATVLCVYRLRNDKYLECMLDEVSGTVGRRELLHIYIYIYIYMYNLATENHIVV